MIQFESETIDIRIIEEDDIISFVQDPERNYDVVGVILKDGAIKRYVWIDKEAEYKAFQLWCDSVLDFMFVERCEPC